METERQPSDFREVGHLQSRRRLAQVAMRGYPLVLKQDGGKEAQVQKELYRFPKQDLSLGAEY